MDPVNVAAMHCAVKIPEEANVEVATEDVPNEILMMSSMIDCSL